MKSLFLKSLVSASLLFPMLAVAAAPSAYRVSIEIREKGMLRNCPGFVGWVLEKDTCVFRYNQVVSTADARLDYTGVVGWARQSGEVDFQYYVGDIDSGFSFKFKIPTQNGVFVFGDMPYSFDLTAGDYASGQWDASGRVILSPVP